MRRRFIAGNWKMFNGPQETKAFFEEFTQKYTREKGIANAVNAGRTEIALFPPYVSLGVAMETREATPVVIGAQNAYYERSGAFTGEISVSMLKETGCTHVLIGHSERRHIFGEQDELLHKKVLAVLEEGLTPVLCVGELLEERGAGRTFAVIGQQLLAGLAGLENDVAGDKIIIAYEPIWAIGTGKTARDEDAQTACAYIRKLTRETFGEETADRIRILYGGSVKPENTKGIMEQPDIDGVLVGGASLKPQSFIDIVKNAL